MRAGLSFGSLCKSFAKDPSTYYKLNVEGAKNVLDIPGNINIKKIVFTSTAGTPGPPGKAPVKEEDARTGEPFTEYEVTKTRA